ncbi:MAG TPA: ComEC/Rec2 family competence protein, partial [Thermoanaerobaculia bacterium]|nr:ComEC/Rec2 family competence protein [Thermoanaerobaculia bacterium]
FALGSRSLEFFADRAAGGAFLRPTPPLAGIVAVGALTAAAATFPSRMRPFAALGAVALFAALALPPGPPAPRSGFSVEALDVGQGDAILLRWDDRALLVDGGGPFDVEAADFGRTRLLPKLLDRGVTRLDAVLATHPHPDHALGLLAVVEELPVDSLWLSAGEDEGGLFAALSRTAAAEGIPVSILRPGPPMTWRNARLTVLHSGGVRRKRDPVNNQSVVLRFERDGRSAVLTGDVGAATERALAAGGRLRPADLLKVAHHGSRTSTTAGFVDALRPRAALLSCGRENRFGHPAAETLATLRGQGVPVFRTDRLSDVRVELSAARTRLAWRGLE